MALEEMNWTACDSFAALVEARTKVISATQLVEDLNGMQAVTSVEPCRSFRRLAVAMAHCLERDVAGQRHSWTHIRCTQPSPGNGSCLQTTVFEPFSPLASMDLATVVSTQQTTGWYGPCPERTHTPVADKLMLRAATKANDLDTCADAWLGECVNVNHCLAFGVNNHGSSKPLDWFIGIGRWKGSSCLFWLAVLRQSGLHQWLEVMFATEPPVMPLFDLSSTKSAVC